MKWCIDVERAVSEFSESYVDLAADLRASVCCDLSTVLRVEVRDLRVVLQSSDKELEATRTELQQQKAEHERETTDLSKSLISTQLQLDTVKYKHTLVLS